MKYELIISGTKDEIEKAKEETESWHVAKNYFRRLTYPNHFHEVLVVATEFRIVEPRYRVKTLVELVQEYGDGVEIKSNSECAFLNVQHCTIATYDLGRDGSYFNNTPDCWKAIFLKEVE
jgi:hypothetical protein